MFRERNKQGVPGVDIGMRPSVYLSILERESRMVPLILVAHRRTCFFLLYSLIIFSLR